MFCSYARPRSFGRDISSAHSYEPQIRRFIDVSTSVSEMYGRLKIDNASSTRRPLGWCAGIEVSQRSLAARTMTIQSLRFARNDALSSSLRVMEMRLSTRDSACVSDGCRATYTLVGSIFSCDTIDVGSIVARASHGKKGFHPR